ncbi:hypothetical protein GCM10027341_31180 [Spirosoma knui]
MRLYPSLAPPIDVRMGNFMDIRNEKRVWIQIGINGDLCQTAGQSAEIAQPGSTRLYYPKIE